MTDAAERARTAGGVLAVIRMTAIPVFFTAERIVEHPNQNSAPFDVLIFLAALYAAVALTGELLGRPLGRPRILAAIDLLGIALLVATSGGPFSQLRYAFFLVPIGTSLLLAPGPTAVVSAAAVGLYAIIALTYPDPELAREDWAGFEVTQALFLAWMGVAATLLAGLLARRTREVERLSASRGRLVGQALDAEDRARRRLAEALHDEALQNVLAVRQMLGSARPEDLDLLVDGLDRSVKQIREAVFDLHPYLLEQAGLEAALRAVAKEAGRRAGFEATVAVEEGATGLHDQLVFALARELIANAAKHARAGTLAVEVSRDPDAVMLAVSDDGIGIDPAAASTAPLRGHIGLASSTERVEAIGGTLTTGPGIGGHGTRVVARLPAPAAEVRPWVIRSDDDASTAASVARPVAGSGD
ncbi:MAG TPA: ATP-binding protein [Solirubrobacteraceae bacterium]|nr:ATP-binding protein [Solirubrobacteraceae bacterium]